MPSLNSPLRALGDDADFRAGWDAAIAVAAKLIAPKPMPAEPIELEDLE